MDIGNTESKFLVLHGGPFLGVGDIIAILTGQQESDGNIFTEWHYLVRTGTSAKGYGFAIHSDYFKTIDNFWESETRQNLTMHIYYNQIVPALERAKDYSLNTEIKLRDVVPSYLASTNAEHPGFLDSIDRSTRCTAYKEYLKLLKSIRIARTPFEEGNY